MLFGTRIQLFWQFWCPWILSEAQTQCTLYASISHSFWYCQLCMTLWVDDLFLWYVYVSGSLEHSNAQKHWNVTMASSGKWSLKFNVISGTFGNEEFVLKKTCKFWYKQTARYQRNQGQWCTQSGRQPTVTQWWQQWQCSLYGYTYFLWEDIDIYSGYR